MQKLKSIRVLNGYTQQDIADKLNITVASYNRKETGQVSFKLRECKMLAELLACTMDDLFSEY